LKDSELVFERGIYPDSACIFNTLSQERLVYITLILNKEEKALHEKIARTMEDIYKEDICTTMVFWPVIALRERELREGRSIARLEAKAIPEGCFIHEMPLSMRRGSVQSWEKLPQTGEIQKKSLMQRITLANIIWNMNFHSHRKRGR